MGTLGDGGLGEELRGAFLLLGETAWPGDSRLCLTLQILGKADAEVGTVRLIALLFYFCLDSLAKKIGSCSFSFVMA